MKKRLWSIILCLVMLAGMMTSVPVVNTVNADGGGSVYIRYFSDSSYTSEITSGKIKVGEDFYATLCFKDFGDIDSLDIALGYNKDAIELISFDGDSKTAVAISHDGKFINKNSDFKNMPNDYGIDRGNLFTDRTSGTAAGKTMTAALSDVSPVLFTTRGLIGFVASRNSGAVKYEGEVSIIKMRFRAKAVGSSDFHPVPANQINVPGSAYDGFGFFCGAMEVPGTNDIVNLNVISGTTPSLDKVEGIKAVGNKIQWDAVSNATKYSVTITKTENGNAVGEPETTVVTTNEVDLPVYKKGDVTVIVKAIGDGENYADGLPSDAVVVKTYKQKLSSPNPVVWSGSKVTWTTVDGADSYELIIYENQKKVGTENVKDTTNFDFDDYINIPNTGQNEYIVSVQAKGKDDDKYVENSEICETVKKTVKGKVEAPTNVKWSEKTATWTSSDLTNVSNYIIVLYKNETSVYEDANVSKSLTKFDFASKIEEFGPGEYRFGIKAVGKNDFADSVESKSKAEIFSANLNVVTDIVWADKTIKWTDDQKGVQYYNIQLYKNDSPSEETIKVSKLDRECNLASYMADGAIYYVEITAVGDGEIYKDSKPAVSIKQAFAEALKAPLTAEWSGKTATWSAVPGTLGYNVVVYYNGKHIEGAEFTVGAGETSLDCSAILVYPGVYTFEVSALGDNIVNSTSPQKKSNDNNNTVTYDGTLTVQFYKDKELKNKVTSIQYGDILYAAFTVDTEKAITAGALPFVFNPEYLVAVDSEGNAIKDEKIADAFIMPIEDFELTENEVYPYVNNQEGFAKIQFSAPTETELPANSKIAAIRLKAVAIGDSIEIGFADSQDEIYDKTAPSGPEFANNEGLVLLEPGSETLSVSKKELVASGLAWNGKTATWDEIEGAESYTVKLYKDGVLVDTVSTDDTSYSFRNNLSKTGEYRFTVTPNAASDDLYYKTGNESDKSAANNIKVSSSSSSTSTQFPGIIITPVKLNDIDGHWAEDAIIALVEDNIINGYTDGSFKPEWGITRAEFTKLLVCCLDLDSEIVDITYDDTINHWAKNYIAIGTKYGLVNGVGDNLFSPDTIVTREQMALILYRIAGKPSTTPSGYADRITGVSDWALDGVDYVSNVGFMKGFEDNTFRGKESTTRAQAATVLKRLIDAKFFDNFR